MTGLNKNGLSIYSKLIGLSFDGSKLKIAFSECNDTLSKPNIRKLSNMGIPIISKNIRTRQELSDYILKEVIDYIPILKDQEFRKINKSLGRLNNKIEKQSESLLIILNEIISDKKLIESDYSAEEKLTLELKKSKFE